MFSGEDEVDMLGTDNLSGIRNPQTRQEDLHRRGNEVKIQMAEQ